MTAPVTCPRRSCMGAAENKSASIGKISQMSGANPQSDAGSGGATLDKGLGVRSATPVSEQAMQPGVSYLQDITLASYSKAEPGTILQSTKNTVYLDSGSRLRFLVQCRQIIKARADG